MDLHVTLTRRGRLSGELYAQLREAILDGRLRAGEALPPTRELAERLEVSRNTVTNAYERLAAEGFLEGRVGAGTFVTAVPARQGRRAPRGGALRPRAAWRRDRSLPGPEGDAPFDFRIGLPDPALFPWAAWRRLVARQARARRHPPGYPAPEGDAGLRAAVARHVGLSRSVKAEAGDVLVCGGAQQAFDLIGRVLLEPGTRVAVEEPGYPLARRAFEANGGRVVPVRVDAEGLDVAALPRDARLVYVTPSHQFPLGTAMSLRRRMELLAWAERHGAALVEDDYDSEFRLDGRPLEPLQSLDRAGRVLYVGTFSKVLLPSLRTGFVVAPASLMPALVAAKGLAEGSGPLDPQLALAALIEEGTFARHVRRLLRVYRRRRDRLLLALSRQLAGAVTPLPSSAGLHVSVLFRDPRVDADGVALSALAGGVAVQSLSAFHISRPRPGLALGYGLIPEERIEEGVSRLAASIIRAP